MCGEYAWEVQSWDYGNIKEDDCVGIELFEEMDTIASFIGVLRKSPKPIKLKKELLQ